MSLIVKFRGFANTEVAVATAFSPRRIYCKKTSDFHRPIFFIIYSSTPAAAKADAPPILAECGVRRSGLTLMWTATNFKNSPRSADVKQNRVCPLEKKGSFGPGLATTAHSNKTSVKQYACDADRTLDRPNAYLSPSPYGSFFESLTVTVAPVTRLFGYI